MGQAAADQPYHAPETLLAHGIRMPAPGQVLVSAKTPLARIAKTGVVLHPGTRIDGEKTAIAAGAEIGALGPCVIKNTAIGRGAKIASGAVEGAVLLDSAALGPESHVRSGTLLEEGASTAHAVGLKQTILLAYATLGSLINFCDCLLAGGRTRKDHSEVGSGFIHFNFTPFGPQGDKATASLFGDVPKGVLMRSDRIFLGGSGGVVGPIEVGYGTVLAAGFTYRRDYAAGLLVYGEAHEARAVPFDAMKVRRVDHKVKRSLRYIGQLIALEAFYREARLAAFDAWAAANTATHDDLVDRAVILQALEAIADAVRERVEQVDRLFENKRIACGGAAAEPGADELEWRRVRDVCLARAIPDDPRAKAALAALVRPERDHLRWVHGLDEEAARAVEHRLGGLAKSVESLLENAG